MDCRHWGSNRQPSSHRAGSLTSSPRLPRGPQVISTALSYLEELMDIQERSCTWNHRITAAQALLFHFFSKQSKTMAGHQG
ncbi:hypothetical protein AOLI_G00203550 [Acnodon oligacanthus]